ncbi:mechanosensitive ion channel family protein [Paraglaciecola aquimarina]|uniref:Mechanosensitive ion channel family protein n=1 Tax=Paraglaciecola aquimarina TaxID=1235557 RepID=A0ABU3SXD2_9ALTE|nr:mechanosensitive ion channel family protein [Paraglaciecola aquimarina]MDU0354674.1 mechanosensitive ion channel family protein [Paraglaciecola aquimarina]
MSWVKTLFENQLVLTFSITFFALLIKYALVKLLRRRAASKGEDRRDLVNNVKNFWNFVLIVMILSIWAHEIQKFAFSIAAFSVAIVLATREFIQCVIGFFYLISTRPFRIGDWIEVDNFVGEVSATDWIKSTLLEVDLKTYEYTGKTLYIPNNKLISNPIKNLNFLKRYATHKFKIIRDQSVNPYVFLDIIIENAKQFSADFYDVAARYNHMIERRLDISIAGPDPKITITTTELGDTQVEVTIFCPTERAIELEQAITQDFLQHWHAVAHNSDPNKTFSQ